MKLNSYTITQGKDRAPARSFLKGIGFTDDDLKKPIIGIANTWIGTMPCNFNLRELAQDVARGIREAGGTPMEFNTIAISDGITMGTEGMKTSLISREVIADSIELVARGHMFDGIVALVACDKTIPGAAMAVLRLNIPAVVLYGGTILPGKYKGQDITIQKVFEAVGENAAGKISDLELLEIENAACPGAGACGGQFTANTMATVMEIIGLSPTGLNSIPQVDERKHDAARQCGEIIMNAVKQNLRPRDIVTRKSIENAIASVAASGGSTNAVLHLLAYAREAEIPLNIDDFQELSSHTPLLSDLLPAGKYTAVDVYKAGGIQVLGRRLYDGGFVHSEQLMVTGKTFAETFGGVQETPGQQVIRQLDNPIKKSGGLVILKGSLAPEGAVIKVTGLNRTSQTGPARVFDSEEEAMHAVLENRVNPGDIVVIRYEGPRGGPGMREMLGVTSAIVGH
jgi:dihydroxy-acid dehydratase